MSGIVPHGEFVSPYGISVPVHRRDPADPADPDAFVFSMESTAICAGIHSRKDRDRFIEASVRLGRIPAFEEFGGHPLVHLNLQRPDEPIYPNLAGNSEMGPLEDIITALMDRTLWCHRAAFLLDVAVTSLDRMNLPPGMVRHGAAFGISGAMTAALEHLCETEIDCIEAAAIYALSSHDEWRRTGTSWLYPYRNTWFRDWALARPSYLSLASDLQMILALPGWLCDAGGDAP